MSIGKITKKLNLKVNFVFINTTIIIKSQIFINVVKAI